jgi:hypothetical protein
MTSPLRRPEEVAAQRDADEQRWRAEAGEWANTVQQLID